MYRKRIFKATLGFQGGHKIITIVQNEIFDVLGSKGSIVEYLGVLSWFLSVPRF